MTKHTQKKDAPKGRSSCLTSPRRGLIVQFLMAAVTLALLLGNSIQISAAAQEAQGKDTSPPTDVENIKAIAGDSEVRLSWDASSDDTAVTAYKIYRGTKSVKTTADTYDLPPIPLGAARNYTVKNLTNNQTYYFTVTSLDAAGNESANYGLEASATPKAGLTLSGPEDNGVPPQVKEVMAEDIVTVKVVFSETVKLPTEEPKSAFKIEKDFDKKALEVQQAEIDARDETGVTVLLTTAPQEENVDYTFTAGIEVQDLFDNPIVSGTADTASFKGSAKKKPEALAPIENVAPVDTDAPAVTGGKADFTDRIEVHFSEGIALPPEPEKFFMVYKKGTQDMLKVQSVSLSPDSQTAYLTTDSQEPVEYEVTVSEVTDLAGNKIAQVGNSAIVTGKGAGIADLIPPEDVTELISRVKNARKAVLELSWKGSKNTAKDLADQILYQSDGKEGKKFGEGTSLGDSAAALEVQELAQGKWYTFKVTTKDTSGNESAGALTSIYLPKTGPGLLAAGITSVFAAWWRRRKRKNM